MKQNKTTNTQTMKRAIIHSFVLVSGMLYMLMFAAPLYGQLNFATGRLIMPGQQVTITDIPIEKSANYVIKLGAPYAYELTLQHYAPTISFVAQNTQQDPVLLPVQVDKVSDNPAFSKAVPYADYIIVLPQQYVTTENVIHIPAQGGAFIEFYADNTCKHFMGSTQSINIGYDAPGKAMYVNFDENTGTVAKKSYVKAYTESGSGANNIGSCYFKQLTENIEQVELPMLSDEQDIETVSEDGSPALFAIDPISTKEGAKINTGTSLSFTVEPLDESDTDFTVNVYRVIKNTSGALQLVTTTYDDAIVQLTEDGISTSHEVKDIYGSIIPGEQIKIKGGTAGYKLSLTNYDYAPWVKTIQLYSIEGGTKSEEPFYESEWNYENRALSNNGITDNCLTLQPNADMAVVVATSEYMDNFTMQLTDDDGQTVAATLVSGGKGDKRFEYTVAAEVLQKDETYHFAFSGLDLRGNALTPFTSITNEYPLSHAEGINPVTFGDNLDKCHHFTVNQINGTNSDDCPDIVDFDYTIDKRKVTFTNTSVLNSVSTADCYWKFHNALGPIKSQSYDTISYTYQQNDTYEVTLRLNYTNSNNIIGQAMKEVTINITLDSDGKKVDFTYESNYNDDLEEWNINLINTSDFTDVDKMKWHINTPSPIDETLSTKNYNPAPLVITNADTPFDITLKAIYNDGSTKQIIKTINLSCD